MAKKKRSAKRRSSQAHRSGKATRKTGAAPRSRSRTRRVNHHLEGAVKISDRVEEVDYRHAQSKGKAAYYHEFAPDVEMLGLRDGSILLRSKKGKRLHGDYIVGDDE